jgi:hypothetical protein
MKNSNYQIHNHSKSLYNNIIHEKQPNTIKNFFEKKDLKLSDTISTFSSIKTNNNNLTNYLNKSKNKSNNHNLYNSSNSKKFYTTSNNILLTTNSQNINKDNSKVHKKINSSIYSVIGLNNEKDNISNINNNNNIDDSLLENIYEIEGKRIINNLNNFLKIKDNGKIIINSKNILNSDDNIINYNNINNILTNEKKNDSTKRHISELSLNSTKNIKLNKINSKNELKNKIFTPISSKTKNFKNEISNKLSLNKTHISTNSKNKTKRENNNNIKNNKNIKKNNDKDIYDYLLNTVQNNIKNNKNNSPFETKISFLKSLSSDNSRNLSNNFAKKNLIKKKQINIKYLFSKIKN